MTLYNSIYTFSPGTNALKFVSITDPNFQSNFIYNKSQNMVSSFTCQTFVYIRFQNKNFKNSCNSIKLNVPSIENNLYLSNYMLTLLC